MVKAFKKILSEAPTRFQAFKNIILDFLKPKTFNNTISDLIFLIFILKNLLDINVRLNNS